MSTNEQMAFDFMQGLIAIISIWWPLIGPVVILVLIPRFFRWLNRRARGDSTMDEEFEGAQTAYWRYRETSLATREKIQQRKRKS
jgi:hypothetical protein